MYLYLYLRNLFAEQDGQDVVEYALLLGFIAIVAWVGIRATGVSINTMWQSISAAVAAIPVAAP